MKARRKDLDGGYAWVVMAASTLSLVLNGCLFYGAGIMHVAFLSHYNESDTYTSFVGSIFTSLLQLIGPFASVLINRFSCRFTSVVGGVMVFIGCSSSFFAPSLDVILVTYGIIAGVGNGLCTTPPLVVIWYYFQERRGLALGVTVAGGAVGMFISGPLIQYLLDSYGLHGTLLIQGALFSNQIVMGLVMRPSTIEIHQKSQRIKQTKQGKLKENLTTWKNILHLDILCDKMFLLIILQYLLWNIPYSMLMLHLPNFSVTKGSSKQDAAFLIFLIGLLGTFGRVLTGLVVGPHGIDPILINTGTLGILSIICGFFPFFSHSYTGQCIFSIVFGLYLGTMVTLITPVTVETLGIKKLSSGLGILYFLGGFGYLVGPIFAGILLDVGSQYEVTFYISGLLLFLASLVTLLSSLWRKEVGNQIEDLSYELPEKEQVKNSTLLNQSGLLAGSIIIHLEENIDRNSSQLHLKCTQDSEMHQSHDSLAKTITVHNLQKSRSVCANERTSNEDGESIRKLTNSDDDSLEM